MDESPPDYRERNIGIVKEMLPEGIRLVHGTYDLEIPTPRVVPTYPRWKGEICAAVMSFDQRRDGGYIFVDAEHPYRRLLLERLALHELGHAAVGSYQRNNMRAWELGNMLDEGIAEHFMIDLLRAYATTHDAPLYLREARLMTLFKHVRNLLPIRSRYTRGYFHVLGLRRRHTIHDIVTNVPAFQQNVYQYVPTP
jgi:hypothetical protein